MPLVDLEAHLNCQIRLVLQRSWEDVRDEQNDLVYVWKVQDDVPAKSSVLNWCSGMSEPSISYYETSRVNPEADE